MNENENTIDELDLDLHFADLERYRDFTPAPGSWASMIQPDPFMEV